jgi:phosphoribosylformimino-5-aminoimidazole carboxamide ribotide isomerase
MNFVIPAIDIRDGKCVRLFRGDYSKEKIYNSDPIDVAEQFKNAGFKLLHIVDLDGAKSGKSENLEIIKKIAEIKNLDIEVGGGIRTINQAKNLIDAGVQNVIISTAAIEKTLLDKFFAEFKEKLTIGVDVKKEFVAVNGWIEDSKLNIFDFLKSLEEIGLKRIIVTDITRDGTLTEPNYELLKEIIEQFNFEVIASGGVANILQIEKLKTIGSTGTIVGTAIYEKRINLEEALKI